MDLNKITQDFWRDGFSVIKGFFDLSEVEAMKNEGFRMVEESEKRGDEKHLFAHKAHKKSDSYFLSTANNCSLFYEEMPDSEVDDDLKKQANQTIAKIGHGVQCNPVFKEIIMSDKIKSIFKALGFTKPNMIQGQIIFKNPKVGGEYTPHQDASFIAASDSDAVAGFWIPLDPATKENGCLEFIPGSHKGKLERQYRRISGGCGALDAEYEWSAPPVKYEESQFVSAPAEPGDLLLIHGLVVHRSGPNKSLKRRTGFVFHAYDKARATYLEDNWLQDNGTGSFYPIPLGA